MCLIIPCYNHGQTLTKLLERLPQGLDVFVIDDATEPPLSLNGVTVIRHEKNLGKAEALRNGFAHALKNGYDTAITIDADLQHLPEEIPLFLDEAKKYPNCIITGYRNFNLPEVPKGRRRMNKFSNFWFRKQTGFEILDTNCGFRAYPLKEIEKLNLNQTRYAFETEIMVKFIWAGGSIRQVPITTVYTKSSSANSHYRPFLDTFKFSLMNANLYFTALFLPKSCLKKLALKKTK